MKKWQIPEVPRWVLIAFVMVVTILNLAEQIPNWVNKWQISRLEYSVEKLIDDNLSEKEWMDSSFLDFEGKEETGSEYYRFSKIIALEAAEEFGDGCTLRYSGDSRIYDKYEQFAPVLFYWQCEFDSTMGALDSYLYKENIDEWYSFLKAKLKNDDNDYRIKNSEAFDTTFFRAYRLEMRHRHIPMTP